MAKAKRGNAQDDQDDQLEQEQQRQENGQLPTLMEDVEQLEAFARNTGSESLRRIARRFRELAEER